MARCLGLAALLVTIALGSSGATVTMAEEPEVTSRHKAAAVIACSSWQPQEGFFPSRVLCDRNGTGHVVWFDRDDNGWKRFGPTPVAELEVHLEIEQTCESRACRTRMLEENAIGWLAIAISTHDEEGSLAHGVDYILYWYSTEERAWSIAFSEPLLLETDMPLFTVEGEASHEDREGIRDILDDAVTWFHEEYAWSFGGSFTVYADLNDDVRAHPDLAAVCYVDGRVVRLLPGCFNRPASIAHEYIHLIQYQRSSTWQPSWFSEGTAIRLADRFAASRQEAGSRRPYWHVSQLLATPSCEHVPSEMWRGSLRESDDYEHGRGARAVSWLALLAGEESLVAFIDREPAPAEWESTFRDIFGITYGAFMDFWDSYQEVFTTLYEESCGIPDSAARSEAS
ncbi:MAG: hypothetical protein F4Y92_02175 [Dehalococcoidia bacterium]|nr:hypothetical protein [Dehalococcoidia bacterium]